MLGPSEEFPGGVRYQKMVWGHDTATRVKAPLRHQLASDTSPHCGLIAKTDSSTTQSNKDKEVNNDKNNPLFELHDSLPGAAFHFHCCVRSNFYHGSFSSGPRREEIRYRGAESPQTDTRYKILLPSTV